MNFTTPRLIKNKQNKFTILFYLDGNRYRVTNGKQFGIDIHPNKVPISDRLLEANTLLFRIHKALIEGWGKSSSLSYTFLKSVQNHSMSTDVKETY